MDTKKNTINFTFLVLYLAGLSAFGSFVNDMFTPALPEMSRYFHCAIPTVQLGLTMGMIGLGIGQIVLGPVSFKYGRKPVLVFSVVLFMVAAVICIFSPTITREFGISDPPRKLNRQLEKVADSFGNVIDI